MTHLILELVHWAGSHPDLAGLLIALIAFTESLAFVGLLVPGTWAVIGAGALVGVGALQFGSTMAWVVAGAVLGDWLSFWLGRRYQDRLRDLGVLRRHPELIRRGEEFLGHHGAKSILFARFVGFARPVVPVVAGMLGMRPSRFYPYDLISGLLWAPAHLLPGMAFGASLMLAGQVAARLAVGLGIIVVLAGLLAYAARQGYRWFAPRAGAWASRAFAWGRAHPRLAWLIGDLFDPDRPEGRSLLLWLILLIGGNWLFFGVLEDVLNRDPLFYASQAVYQLLQQLRTPVGDRIMAALASLGDAAVIGPVAVTVLVWLLRLRGWRDAKHWLAAVAFGLLASEVTRYALPVPHVASFQSSMSPDSFPGSGIAISTVVYGFLAVLCATSFARPWRWLSYAGAVLLVGGIAFSTLYLGVYRLADVVAGLSMGAAWVAVLAIARARHARPPGALAGLPVVALLTLAGSGAWQIHQQAGIDLRRYASETPSESMTWQAWWTGAWRRLPAQRIDLGGVFKQPLNLQWAGDLASIQASLEPGGWRRPLALSPRSAARLLLPSPTIAQLPVLPQLNNGQYEALLLVKDKTPDQEWILRLWPAATLAQANGSKIWVGSVGVQDVRQLPLISYAHMAGGYDPALLKLRAELGGLRWKMVQRSGQAKPAWSGGTLLVTENRIGLPGQEPAAAQPGKR